MLVPASQVLLAALACSSAAAAAAYGPADNLRHVNPLIGTANGGHAFPGATLPYGMAKASPDVDGDDDTDGFALPPPGNSSFNVTGFSAMHDSGSGSKNSLGTFPLFPYVACPADLVTNCNMTKEGRAIHYNDDSIVASPGYFALTLKSGIRAEMTTTEHAALFHFKFPASAPAGEPVSPVIALDLTDLGDSRQNGSLSVDDATGRIVANATFQSSFGVDSYQNYVCVDFKGAPVRDAGIWVNTAAGTERKSLHVRRGFSRFYTQTGGWVRFHAPPDGVVAARVGVSLISSARACQNAEKELPDWDFEGTRRKAEDAWRHKLSPVSIDAGGASDAFLQTVFSGIYRDMISPQDYTGENPLWQSDKPYFDSYYCIWDSFRVQHPLLTIVDPLQQSRMINGLLNIFEHEGWMPDCRMSLCKGFTQGGSNADVVIADGYVKNLTGIDWHLAYRALVKDAEEEPYEWAINGRGGLQSWHRLGYIPKFDFDYSGWGIPFHSASRHVEYAYNDYCVAIVAKGLGHQADYEKYLARAGNWRNLFDPNVRSKINGTDTGFQGFLQPRFTNGTFSYFEPSACSPLDTWCSLSAGLEEVFEDALWTYTFYAPATMAEVIHTLGGPDLFIKRLDFLHNTPGLTDVGNEPSFLTSYLYHYAGRPALSVKRKHTYVPAKFNNTPDGLPGNDDSGAMGAYASFAMMGLFPVAGQNVYLITDPYFREINITSPQTNKTATIRTINFDPKGKNIYIQSAKVNGQEWTKSWIGHELFLQGWTLELTMGDRESETWGRNAGDLPPSVYTGKAKREVPIGVIEDRGPEAEFEI